MAKKKLMALVLALFTWMGAQAGMFLVVELTDGTEATFELEEYPTLSFLGDNLIVDGNAYIIYDVAQYSFRDIVTQAQDGKGDTGITVRREGNVIKMSGLRVGSRVTVVSVDGKVLLNEEVNKEGMVELNLNGARQGVYVVRSEGVRFKVVTISY